MAEPFGPLWCNMHWQGIGITCHSITNLGKERSTLEDKMEKQTIFKATTTESVSDNSSRFGSEQSEDNNEEATKESKQEKKKKTKAARKKVSGMTRQEEIESKLLCYLLCRVKA